MSTETIRDVHTLTVRELSATLQQRGFEMSYKTLSNLLNTDDISEQLGITGERNAKHIPANVVDILIEFLPQYKENKGTLPQAATMLKNYLQLLNQSENSRSEIVEQKSSTGTLLPVERFASTRVPVERFASTRELSAPMLVNAIVEAIQRTQPVVSDDALLDKEAAARLLACSPDSVSRYVKGIEGRRGIWKRSDVLRYLAEQKQRK